MCHAGSCDLKWLLFATAAEACRLSEIQMCIQVPVALTACIMCSAAAAQTSQAGMVFCVQGRLHTL